MFDACHLTHVHQNIQCYHSCVGCLLLDQQVVIQRTKQLHEIFPRDRQGKVNFKAHGTKRTHKRNNIAKFKNSTNKHIWAYEQHHGK